MREAPVSGPAAEDRRPRLRRRAVAVLGLLLVACAILAFAAQMVHLRWDMTEGHIHTLSSSTRAVLAKLDDPIMIRAYVTKDLPEPYGRMRRFIEDELRSYHEAGHGKVGYEMVDPQSDPNVAAALAAMRIPRVQVQSIQNDKAQIKQGYLAVVVEYLDKKAIIPVVQSEQGFEYLLTSKIKRLTGKGRTKVGVVSGFGATPLSRLRAFAQLVGDDYQLVDVPLDKPDAVIPDDVKVLVVDGFEQAPSERARYLLDQFRMSGRGLLVLAGNAKPDLSAGFAVRPVKPEAEAWLKDMGVAVEPGLVLDTRATAITVNTPNGKVYVDYPFIPEIRDINQSTPVTHGLNAVSLPFVSPLAWAGQANGSRREVLLRSSDQSARQAGPPYDINPLMPLVQRFTGVTFVPSILAVAEEGPATSAFAKPPAGANVPSARDKSADSRLIVVGSPGMLDDELFNGNSASLTLNMLDWLARDASLIALRSRSVIQRPLIEVGSTERMVWKGLWMFGLPLVVGLAGLGRWLVLRRRQAAGARPVREEAV
jgi:gliding-associated putative ABC transporter substrate-binding component GldG